MHGQFYGSFTAKDGGEGIVWTLIDPDRRAGQVAFKNPAGTNFVAEVRILGLADRTFEVEIVPNLHFERFYAQAIQKVPEDTQYRAKITFDQQWGRGQGHVSELNGATVGALDLYRVQQWSAPADRTLQSWRECKEWMDSHRHEGPSLYRGQGRPLPMTTTFHRTGRVDLLRYLQQDVPLFADYVTTYGERRYEMNQPDDRGAVIALAQHHGFPSPLLDWSASPYIAASFAFSSALDSAYANEPARLFRLTPEFLRDASPGPVALLICPWPQVELYRPPSLGNTRMLSQQGMFLFSSVPSPEWLIKIRENRSGRKYLEVIDVPSDLLTCKEALTDLRRMGISPAALFPGLDGIARALKHELFFAWDGAPPAAPKGELNAVPNPTSEVAAPQRAARESRKRSGTPNKKKGK